jgi:hypothetical protein
MSSSNKQNYIQKVIKSSFDFNCQRLKVFQQMQTVRNLMYSIETLQFSSNNLFFISTGTFISI